MSFDFYSQHKTNKLEDIFDYYAALKVYQKFKDSGRKIIISKFKDEFENEIVEIKNEKELIKEFPFSKDKLEKLDNSQKLKLKNKSFDLFVLEWLKWVKIKADKRTFDITIPKSEAEKFSGIFQSADDFKRYIENLSKYSFGLWAEIVLTEPYYSADDDPFYPVNPVMKEHTWKVPMVRGSSWKGALASVFKNYIIPNNHIEDFKSFARIFGLGSDEFRKIFKENKNEAEQALLTYALFDLGIDNFKYKKGEDLLEKILAQKEPYLLPHKGRLVIYPTYFDKLSLEIINPHSRKTRAGTNPVQYEVVPRGAKGILQMVYIPFDAVLEDDNKIKEQLKTDLENITKALEKFKTEGIGAKTKLGWGQFKIKDLENSFIKNF